MIAVDGPSGSGKSSAARGVARSLGLRYLDTGAMYRAVTWWMLEHGIDVGDTASVIGHATGLAVEVSTDPDRQLIRAGGTDVTAEIRSRRVSNAVSAVASIGAVRDLLIASQRHLIDQEISSGPGIVAEGRDIGTVVAPDAAVKVYLTASEQVRAKRRAAELTGELTKVELTRAEQAARDRRDAPQSSPAADAVEIDATDLTLDQVIGKIIALAMLARQETGHAAGLGADQRRAGVA